MPTDDQFYDLPFIYAYNADSLTTGQTYLNVSLPLLGGGDQNRFLMRRVAGRNLVSGTLRWKDPQNRDCSSALSAVLPDYVVAPELAYPETGMIAFDLGVVAKASNAYATGGSVPNYYSQLAFQGVRRLYGIITPDSAYAYYEKPHTITWPITVNWTGRTAPLYTQKAATKQFTIPVNDYDFELRTVQVLIQKATDTYPSQSSGSVKLTLYDANQQALSNVPVVDSLLSYGAAGFNSCFPVPAMLYPASSVIRVDVESLLVEADVSATLTLLFDGVWRYPCNQ
jgi:hypothetical protein